MSRVHLHRYGQGPVTLVGLHGWAGDHRTFARVAEHLPPEGPSLLALDMPGYGQSPPPRRWTLEAIAGEIADAVVTATDGPVVLVGNCSGALVALHVQRLLGDQVARLVLIEPFAFLPWYFGIFLTPLVGRFFYGCAFQNPLGRWITDRSMKDRRQQGGDLAASFRALPASTTLGYLRLLADMGQAEDFVDVGQRRPVTLLHGDNTFAAVRTSVQRWHRLWPHARATLMPEAGHLLLQETPAQAAALLLDEARLIDGARLIDTPPTPARATLP